MKTFLNFFLLRLLTLLQSKPQENLNHLALNSQRNMKVQVLLTIHTLLSVVLAASDEIIQAVPLAADSTLSNLIIEADGSSQGMMLFGHIEPLTSVSGDGLSQVGLQVSSFRCR